MTDSIKKRTVTFAALLLCASWAASPAHGQATDASGAKSDNTKVNQRDRSADATTADQQKMNASDRELTRKIRRALVKDKSLSTYAHNVKVVSQDGTVTLKGPVRSEAEKAAVEAKANEVVGSNGKVVNELSIAPKNGKTP